MFRRVFVDVVVPGFCRHDHGVDDDIPHVCRAALLDIPSRLRHVGRIGLPQALLAIPGIRYAVVSNGAAVCDLCSGVMRIRASVIVRPRTVGRSTKVVLSGKSNPLSANDPSSAMGAEVA